MMDHPMPGHGQMPGMAQPHGQGTTGMHGRHAGQAATATPTLPGQDAFGAIQEIVRMLEADPKTDWSKVNLAALRQHLIDMNEVTLKADALEKPVEGGLSIAVTGSGRTLAAIERMIPAHARELSRLNGWSAKTEALPNGWSSVREHAEKEGGDRIIEMGSGKIGRLHVHLTQLDVAPQPRLALLGFGQHARAEVDADDLGRLRIERHVAPGPHARIEDVTSHAGEKRAPDRPIAAVLEGEVQEIVVRRYVDVGAILGHALRPVTPLCNPSTMARFGGGSHLAVGPSWTPPECRGSDVGLTRK